METSAHSLIVEIEPHSDWVLDGHDLHTRLRIPAWLAALGPNAELRTLKCKVRAKVPAGSSFGTKIRLKGLGFPAGDDPGDLYAELEIEMPKRLTNAQKDAYRTLKSMDLKGA